MARDKFDKNNLVNVRLKLITNKTKYAHNQNSPSTSEVAIIIVSDIEGSTKDIIIESKGGNMQRINELHPFYLVLQYPLIFPM